MPKHEWTFICRQFAATITGTFSIIDCFHDLLPERFPANIGSFIIVSSFLGRAGETFEYKINFLGPNSNRIIQSNPMQLTCHAERFAGYNATARQPFDGLIVNNPCTIVFNILVNNEVIHQDSLHIESI